MIPRLIEPHVYSRLTTLKKVVVLLGARQVGKTTLLMSLQSRLLQEGKSTRYLNCDLEEERQAANTTSKVRLDLLVAGMDAILIDEVQRLDDPGLTLKILVDQYPDLMILATGSSSFDLRSRVSEALTGRYVDFFLYPLSLVEILHYAGVIDDLALRKPTSDGLLNDLLLFGSYPEIYLEPNPLTKRLLLSESDTLKPS